MLCRIRKSPVKAACTGPYRFGCGCPSGQARGYRMGFMWLSVFSCNLKQRDANKFTFLIVSKK